MQPWPSRSRLDAGNSSRHHREAGQRPGGLWRPWRRARVQHRTRGEPPARLRLGTQPPRTLRHVNECTPSQATHPSLGSTPRPGPLPRLREAPPGQAPWGGCLHVSAPHKGTERTGAPSADSLMRTQKLSEAWTGEPEGRVTTGRGRPVLPDRTAAWTTGERKGHSRTGRHGQTHGPRGGTALWAPISASRPLRAEALRHASRCSRKPAPRLG